MDQYVASRNGRWLRQWMSVLLSTVMLLSYLPVPVTAATSPSDGTVDYSSLVVYPGTTVSAANLANLNDDNPSTHAGDFRPDTGRSFTLDFGEDFGVKVTEVQMQARSGFADRLYNGRVQASVDGIVWTEITSSMAISSANMQSLSIKTEHQNIPYRYLKIMGDGNSNIFNIGEMRIHGTRVQLESLISGVSIKSDNVDSTKAAAGDAVTLSFKSTAPISNVTVSVNGNSYAAHSVDQINWSAGYTISPYEFPGPVSFAINYTDEDGSYGKSVTKTTDESVVTIQELSDYIDVLSETEAFGIPALDVSNNNTVYVDYSTSSGRTFAGSIMDKNLSTYLSWNGPWNNGSSTFLVFDMGEGNGIALDRAYILARADQIGRLGGTYLQGSIDGTTWTTISTSAQGIADWQTLSITDKTSYRYLKITNDSRWYLNMAEIKFYGKQRLDGVLYSYDLQNQMAIAQDIVNGGQGYNSDTSWQALEQALAHGQTAIDKLDSGNVSDLTQADIDVLTSDLRAAISGLKQEVKIISVTSDEGFIHPGISVTKEVLENLRSQIENKQEPWYSYYTAMLETDYAKTAFTSSISPDGITVRTDAYNASNVKDMASKDGTRAFTQSILYYITGNETYRSNALRIIRLWGQMDPNKYRYFTDSHIHTGPPLYNMIMAAEILRYTTSSEELRWTDQDTETFTKNVIDPTVKTFLDFNDKFMNQHNYPLYGSIAAYIFKNDSDNYAKAMEWLTVNDSAPDKYMTGSIYWLFREMTQNDETGEPVAPHVQHVEMGRDLAHGEGDVTNFINLARMVDAQGTKVDPASGTISATGVSIYEFLNDRILMGTDYYAKFSEGFDINWTPVISTAASEWAKEKVYSIPSDEYKGRMHYLGTGGWDLYYVYRYKLGYTEEQLEAKAPYFVKAFKSRVAPNHYFTGDGSDNDAPRVETGAEWWIYVPKEVANEQPDSISRTVRENTLYKDRYLLQLEDAYSIIDGSNQIKESTSNISTKTEGDVSYISTIASDNQTLFAAYRLMFINRNNTSNVALKIRTNGLAKLELKKDKDSVPFQTLELPDTNNQWQYVTFDMGQNSVSYGQFPSKTFMAYFNVVGDGTNVDIDYMDIKADNTLTPPSFRNITTKNMNLSLFAGGTINYDFSAVDTNSSDVITYHLQGDALHGATLDPATGAFSWTPTSQEKGSYQCLVVASDGITVSTVSLTIHVADDRQAAIEYVGSHFDTNTMYESESLEKYEDVYNKVLGMVNTASDSEFYSALNELSLVVASMKQLNPRLSDGSLDFTKSSIKSSLQSGYEAYLIDNNTVTFSGDLSAKYFIMDFGPNFRVAPAHFALQPRNIWPERMSGAIVYGSNDGDTWVPLTEEAGYSNQMQTLNVKQEQLGEAYRYFKISTYESKDYYAKKNTILSVGEFRIYGDRVEIPTRISSVSISSNAESLTQHMQGSGASSNAQVPVKKAIAGNELSLSITAKQPLTELKATIAGMDATVTKLDDLHYMATVTLSPEAARWNASRNAEIEVNYKYLDAKNNQIETSGLPVVYTTDGSVVLVSDVSSRIDHIMDKATLTFNRSTDVGTEIGPRLFDRNTSTFVDIRNSSSAGDGVFYLFDFGDGAVSLSSVEIAPRMTTNLASRMIGTYVAGSNDGVTYKPISSESKNIWDWQGLSVTDSTYYRYIKVTNNSSWFGNLSELEFFGSYAEDRSSLIVPPVVQSAVPGDGKVTLTWGEVPGAVSYNVYASTISGSFDNPVQTVAGDVHSYDVTGLANGMTYYFAISAITSNGSSGLSPEVSAVPGVDESLNLSSLWLSEGDMVPAFDPNVTAYTVNVTNAVYSVSVTASVYDLTSTLKINGIDTLNGSPFPILLDVGDNPLTIQVNGLTGSKTYQITVVREEPDGGTKSSNADLSELVLSSGSLLPIFSSDVTEYSATVEYSISSLSISASLYDDLASLKVNGAIVASNSAISVPLQVGVNQIKLEVTAEDGTVKVYTLYVTRGSAPVSVPEATNSVATNPIKTNGSKGTEATVSAASLIFNAEPDSKGQLALVVKPEDLLTIVEQSKDGKIFIVVESSQALSGVTVQLPAQTLLQGLEGAAIDSISFRLGLANVRLSADRLAEAAAKANANHLILSMSALSQAKLSSGVKERIGGKLVYDFELLADGKSIVDFTGQKAAMVELNYVLNTGEHSEKIVVYGIDKHGMLQVIRSSRYNQDTGKLFFVPEQFTAYTILEADVGFNDLTSVSWAENAILNLAAREIIDGMAPGQYQPDLAVTRAQFVKLLVESLNLRTGTDETGFTDTLKGAWYYEAVAAAKEAGIIQGYEDGRFGVNEPISRQDIAVMVDRALAYVKLTLNSTTQIELYKDESDLSSYAKQSVARLSEAGVLNGLSEGRFAPLENATRAQAAVIIYRILQAINTVDDLSI
ncbi:Endo-1,4-beta-xylanase A precursor [compost metagenome]